MIHALSDVQTKTVGSNTDIWQFCVVLPGANIGDNCNICANCFIENDVVVGNNVTVKCGVQLWDGVVLEDDVFVGPNVTFCNDIFPRSKNHKFEMMRTVVKKGASVGANSTILCGVTIGENSMIGAGSVVTKDVGENEVWLGNPAKFVRMCEKQNALDNNYMGGGKHFLKKCVSLCRRGIAA